MAFLFCLWLGFAIKANYYDIKQLEKHGVFTVSEITSYERGAKGSWYTHYKYSVDGEIYESSINTRLTGCPLKRNCVGSKFKLIYSSKNPNIHNLIEDEQLNDSLKLGEIIRE